MTLLLLLIIIMMMIIMIMITIIVTIRNQVLLWACCLNRPASGGSLTELLDCESDPAFQYCL